MKYSETQSKLVAALIACQGSFPVIAKNKQGQAGHRQFRYAPIEDVLDAVRPVLLTNNVLLTQAVEGHELVTRLDHISGEWRESRMPINPDHANMQSYGIELTYRRRYAIQPMLGIVTEEDTDGAGGQKRKGKDHTEPRNENGTIQTGVRASAKDVLRECFERVQPEYQDALRLAAQRINALASMADAKQQTQMVADSIASDEIDEVTAKQAIWYLLDAKTRKGIKEQQ